MRHTDGEKSAVIKTSWKQSIRDLVSGKHQHLIIIADPIDYLRCPVQGKNLGDCRCWFMSFVDDVHIHNAEGELECLHCALSREAPDVKFTEIQKAYLRALGEGKTDDVDTRWAQALYDEQTSHCIPKPAKF